MKEVLDAIEESFDPIEHTQTDDGWCSVIKVGNENISVTTETIAQVTVTGCGDASVLLRDQLKKTLAGFNCRIA